MTWAWEEISDYVLDLFDTCDTILIGRKLAVDYIPYWEDTFTKPDDPMYEVARRIVAAKKVVFTRTLDSSPWDKTELAKGDLVEEVNKLKAENGKDIIVYGGTSFVSELIEAELIDEYHLFLNPVALGMNGVPIFDRLDRFRQLKLAKTITYNSGIVLLNYAAVPAE